MEEVHWRQLSREIWLREGDRNTGFFHRMANAHRRVNNLIKIKINGVRLTEDQEVRDGIVNAYQHLLSENADWKADIGGLVLKQISLSEADALELPFTEAEIYAALMGMNGDKAPGPDGFTVAFWQNCWEIVKEDVLDMFKEFYDQNSFIKSLNHTFLVLIPKKGGAEDLGDYRPISLLGGLYKLLAKVLANRLKKIIDKVISPDQNAFIKGRQILDGSLIANEVIDSWQKRGEKGLICKLDIEKAFDNINWQFLLKVLHKMGFGSKWIGWMWSCISTIKYSMLVNGVPAGFFSSSKGLRQGDPLSPYLFIMGMEVLSALISRAVEGGFIYGCRIWKGRGQPVNITHLLFADDTIVFCEAKKESLLYLSWILLWFEAASGLKINLEKSMVIPVGEVEGALDMAAEIGCKVGQLPTVYLGLPLGAPNRASSVWDGVEEKMRRKLALWKRHFFGKKTRKASKEFLWGGANGGNKAHLIKWEVVCTDKKKGGLGLRKLIWLNKALLGKWIWRFARAKEELWKKVLEAKYGKEEFGWRSKKANGVFGVGVWKEILKESTWCWDNMVFKVGKGNKVRFWIDPWCGNNVLSEAFPDLFSMAVQRSATVEDYWDQNLSQGGWSLRLLRDFNDWELGLVDNMLVELRNYRVSMEEDSVFWRGGADGLFKVKEAYRVLVNADEAAFPHSNVWVAKVPTKITFFAWEATWGKVLTLDRLQRRGWHLPNRCFLCGCEEETINHILIHCTVAKGLWDIILALCGVQWVFPNSVKEVLSSWKGSFVGRKRKKVWKSIPLFIFWTIWKERNRLAFKGGVLAFQKLKTSFVYNFWGWAKVYIDMESNSLIEEIHKAIFQLDRDKAPGPDDFTIAVFQDCWDVIKEDLVRVFAKFHSSGIINQSTNVSFIVLLPKKSMTKKISDFRPISLITSLYKIIAKVLSGLLIANEIVDEKRRSGEKGVVLKSDFEKAYDHVSWGFLDHVLEKKGFSPRWRKWMRGCLSTVSFAVLVNGNAKGWVKASRGLRQDDPLSPFLFTLVADVLSRMLLRAEERNSLEGFRVGQNSTRVSHLQFADDTIFFSNTSEEDLQTLKSLLLVFGQIFGLKVNLDKSNIYDINLDQNHLSRLAELLDCKASG
ncbi:LINE-1 reverse transcriptase-like [Vitis vinifera]|uniref:LINE-1 reverse transcriptase-like n=1 Tax=Vitis vinifera TaxID=29760 RepID=A0A438C0B8_VITVI|nr:LINE-1 reverse transcriptase-like [Vitis vinifera]